MNLPTIPTDKPATINTRSDAASANEMATAVMRGAGTTDQSSWRTNVNIKTWTNGWIGVFSPTGAYSIGYDSKWHANDPKLDSSGYVFFNVDKAAQSFACCNDAPPDWPLPTVSSPSVAASVNGNASSFTGLPDSKAAATVSRNAGSDTVPGGSIPAATVPAWKAACKVVQAEDGRYTVASPTGAYWACSGGVWNRNHNTSTGVYGNQETAEEVYKELHACPPDWPTPAHTDDPREEPERFCEATGPVVGGAVTTTTSPDGRYSVTSFKPNEPGLHKISMPVETVTYSDPSPCGNFIRKITKPAEPIEKLIDRLAHIRDCHKIDWQFQIRVTGDVEKAEPRSYDSPGYPEHFALHHVYLGEDLTRAILTTIAYDLDSKGMDKPTVRKVLDSVARAFQLTAEFGETDLIGMAVAVEDKLDIGKE